MSDVTVLETSLRKGQFNYTGHLVTVPRIVVLQGTITATDTYPALQVSYTLTDGNEANVTQDMTVVFYSSTGDLKAVLRVASGQSITSTTLPINEFSRSLYNVTIGDTFKVYQDYRILDRLVAANETFNKDSRIAYTNQLSDPVPVCNSGGPYAGFGASVSFEGSTSFTTDPDTSGTLIHAWDFIDGTPSTSSAENPTGIVFPVGFREIKHTVTDTGNSKSTTQYVPVWVVDRNTYKPLRVQMDSLNEPAAQATRISFKLPYGTEGNIATLPDGAPIVYFEREFRKGVEGSYGSNVANRSHVKFSGYLVRDSLSIDGDTNEVTFEAVNALGILEETPALPQLMVSNAAPTTWSEVRGLSTKEILWYLSYWGSTLQTAWDFVWTDGLDLDYARIATEAETIAEQLRDIANGLNVQVTCDALGRIQFIRDPDFLTPEQRAGRTIAYNFTTADIIKIEVTREHRGTTKAVRGEGITPTNDAVFANAPGSAPSSMGTGSDTLAKQIVSSQDDINSRTVKRWAQLNGIFNGRFVPKNLRMTVPDGYDVIQVANGELVTLALPANTNTRGIAFTDTERWTVQSRDITYDSELGAKEIIYTISHETFAEHSDDNIYTPPQEDDNGLPDSPPIDVVFPPLGVDPGTGLGVDPAAPPVGSVTSPSTATMAIFCADNFIYFTANFNKPESSGGPDWTTTAPIDLAGLTNWGGGTLIAFEIDPYSPAYLSTGDEVNGVILSDEMVQRIEDIFGSPTLDTANVFDTPSTARTLAMDRSVEGFGITASWIAAEGVYAATTDDGGATWTESLVTAFENTAAGGIAPGVFISPHTAGKAYISVWTATGDNTDAEASLYKTINSGASWSHLTAPDIDSGVDVSSFIGVAFDNAPANVIYHRRKDADGLHLIRNKNGVETDITPTISELSYVPIGQRLHEIAIADDDLNTMVMIGATGAAVSGGVWSVYPGFGTFVSQTSTSITVDAEFNGSQYQTMVTTSSADICSDYGGYTVDSGDISAASTFWNACGETPGTLTHSGLLTSGCINSVSNASFTPYRVTYHFSGDDCGEGSGVIDFGALISRNAYDETPTWDMIGHGEDFPYRQVFSLGGGKFLLLGLNGAIAISSGTSINSRKGNIASTTEVVGTAGI